MFRQGKKNAIWAVPPGMGTLCGLLVLGSTGVGAETGARPAAGGPRTCIDINGSESRRVVSRNEVLVEDGFGRSALLSLSAPCSNLNELDMIGFEINGSSYLCGPHDMNILYSRHGESPLICLIRSVRFMNREETRGFEANEKAASDAAH